MKNSNDDKMNTDSAEATETNPAETNAGEAATTRANGGDGQAAASEPASADLAGLQAQAAKAKEHWDLLVRTTADFDNYKKRAAREKQDAIKFANEGLLQKLISVLDNFDMAIAAVANNPSQDPAARSLQTGVNMILSQFRNVLTEAGLEEIDALDQTFDPNFHEAISQEDRTDVPEGRVVQQVRKGYKLRDRLLRPASVVVSRKPSA